MSTIGSVERIIGLPPKPAGAAFGATTKYPWDTLGLPKLSADGTQKEYDTLPILVEILEPRVVPVQTPEGGTVAQTIPGDDATTIKKKVKALYVNVSSALKRYKEKTGNENKRFEVRKLEKGVRVWRVEDVVDVPTPVPAPFVTPAPAPASVPAPPAAPATHTPAPGKKGK